MARLEIVRPKKNSKRVRSRPALRKTASSRSTTSHNSRTTHSAVPAAALEPFEGALRGSPRAGFRRGLSSRAGVSDCQRWLLVDRVCGRRAGAASSAAAALGESRSGYRYPRVGRASDYSRVVGARTGREGRGRHGAVFGDSPGRFVLRRRAACSGLRRAPRGCFVAVLLAMTQCV